MRVRIWDCSLKLNLVVFGVALLTGWQLSAQYELQGKVIDAQTEQPIPFVNIGILGERLGTVSNTLGAFDLQIPKGRAVPEDLLRFSSLGYEAKEVPLNRIGTSGFVVIRLEPTTIALEEVVVSVLPTYTLEEIVGYPLKSSRDFAYWKDSLALGAELASRIRVSKGLRKLNTLFFNTRSNPADSLLLRINVYEFKGLGRAPGKNLNTSGKNILYTLRGGAVEAVVDLEPYDLWAENDFVLSLELLEVYGSDLISLTLPATGDSRGETLRRYASQGDWEEIGNYGVGYYLQTTAYTDDIRKAENKKVVRRLKRTQEKVSGFVFYGRNGLENVLVENLNTNEETRSDARGRYEIMASPGDLLRYTRDGGYGEFKILKVNKPGNITVNLRRR